MSAFGTVAIVMYFLFSALQTPAIPPAVPPPSAQPNSQKPASPLPTPKQPPPTAPTGGPPMPPTTSVTPPAITSKPDDAKSQPPIGVTAEPNPCLPGQTVTFYLPDDVKHGTVLGGRYTHRRELMPEDTISDEPKKATAYTFDLVTSGDSVAQGKPAPQAARHQQSKVTVDVYAGSFPRVTTYRNPQHWRIDTVAGWIRNVVPQADPSNESLIYFQPRDDSPERVSVAVVVVKDTNCADLMKTVLMDAPTQYDILEHVQQKPTTHCGVEATWATFDGVDHAQPDTQVKSMVMTFVRDRKGYVISGRARANRYDQWEKLLHSLVRSFCVDSETQPKPGS